MKAIKSNTTDYQTGHRSRLKEKFIKSGLTGFHDYEILELLLTYAIPRRDVKPIAKELTEHFKDLQGIFDADLEELKNIKGLGEHSAILIKLLKEAAAVYLKERIENKNIIDSVKSVMEYCRYRLSGERDEVFLVLYLNAKNEIIKNEILQRGTIDQTVIYPRKVMEQALKHNACSLIFVHNHPSGDPAPSEADKELTKILTRALRTVDITVHDHLITGKNACFSARENGWIT